MGNTALDKWGNYCYAFIRDPRGPFNFISNRLYQFIYLSEGEFTATIENEKFTVHAGEMLYIPTERTWTFEFGPYPIIRGVICHFRSWPNVDELDYHAQIIRVDDALKQDITMLPTAQKEVDCRYIWTTYRFLTKVQPYMQKNDSKYLERIESVLEYMRTHENYTIPELIAYSGMKKSNFYLMFEKLTGVTPVQAKHRFHAMKAEMLLIDTDLSVDDVAQKIGFHSTAHFRKIFGNRYGFSPKELRKRHKDPE